MITSFSTALSALSANETAIDVVGNNLANLNTPGFKEAAVDFSDAMYQTLGGGSQVGFGVSSPSTRRIFTQGAAQPGSGPLTAMIQGEGFFQLQGASGEKLYTRVGNFKESNTGYLVSQSNELVMGSSGPIQMPTKGLPPVESKNFAFDVNLDARSAVGDTYSSPAEVVDSLGVSHVLKVSYTKTAANTWSYGVSCADGTAALGSGATGTLTFDTNGKPIASSPTSDTVTITGLTSGAADMALTWNFLATDGVTSRVSQEAKASSTDAPWQDGSIAANLTGVSIGADGYVVAEYSNGQHVNLDQLAVVTFTNPDSLVAVGNNNFKPSATTSTASPGVSGAGGHGLVVGGSLEASTVDIAKEFTNLIVYQRGYQAASRVITAADEITQETINLKR